MTVTIFKPNQEYEPRLNQLDLRLTRAVSLGLYRMQFRFDVYNVTNSAAILSETLSYGSTFRKPTSVLAGRLFKFGLQFDY